MWEETAVGSGKRLLTQYFQIDGTTGSGQTKSVWEVASGRPRGRQQEVLVGEWYRVSKVEVWKRSLRCQGYVPGESYSEKQSSL